MAVTHPIHIATGEPSPPFRRLNVQLRLDEGETIDIALDVADQPARYSDIVPVAMAVDDRMVELAIRRAGQHGEEVHCREGCCHCCRYVVAMSYPEACYLLDVLRELPAETKASALEWFAETYRQAEQAGIVALAEAAPTLQEALAYLGDWMRKENRADCPFLRDERCCIYDHRSATCREFLSLDAPGACQALQTRRPRMPINIGLSLSMLHARLTDEPAGLVALPLFQTWIDKRHLRGRETFPAVDLVEAWFDILRQLAARLNS
jgi:Fe-S-cluster containining protein